MRISDAIRILLYGKDARTDAMAAAFKASSAEPELFAYSDVNIPGLVRKCIEVRVKPLTDLKEMMRFAREVKPTLAVIGPEEPLDVGLVDALEREGIPCFGPHSELARIETSKSWARMLLDRYNIPGNPRYRVFATGDGLENYLQEMADFVVKPDGLTGGKGVKVFGEHFDSRSDALEYALEMVRDHGRVVIEERLEGEEFSLQTITDGAAVVHCPIVQDHKRADEGDVGLNTGGMGSYSCSDFSLPFLDSNDVLEAKRINEQVIDALQRETGRAYRGVLYGGFMATSDGIRLIEYNARFGDPEAMNVLSILETDFVDLCESVVKGRLRPSDVQFKSKATVCKYVVPNAYPMKKGEGDPIVVPDESDLPTDLRCYWAAVKQTESQVLLTESRAIAFVGIGDNLSEAEQRAEEGARSVEGPVRHRSDIGTKPAIEARVHHMEMLRASG